MLSIVPTAELIQHSHGYSHGNRRVATTMPFKKALIHYIYLVVFTAMA